MPSLESLGAHAWTILPAVAHDLFPRSAPAGVAWSTTLDDPAIGPLTLHGSLRDRPDSDACLIVVHGMGGSVDAHYCIFAARAAEQLGVSCLRLSLRGADRQGEDFYHAGLTDDLVAAVASPALARYRRLYVLGYSLGGHMTLRYGLQLSDSRVRALAAVCAPLDLELSAQAIDRTRVFLYRHYLLRGLKEIYGAVAQRRKVPTELAAARAIRTLRHWDNATVVPRFGFQSAEHYYATVSVGPRLRELAIPTMLVQVEPDPMVPLFTYERHLHGLNSATVLHRLNVGGHVGFPARLALGDAAPAQLETRVVEWLLSH
jgi:predicted alpha/beta-fold hydrolase